MAANAPSTNANASAVDALVRLLPYLAEKRADSEFLYILEGVETKEFAPGAPLFRQGHRVERVFLVVSGEVDELRSQSSTRHVLVRESREGALLGIYDLLGDQRHSTGARARTAVTAIEFTAAQINRLLFRFPEFRNRIIPFERISRLRTIPLVGRLDLTALGFLAEASAEEAWEPGARIYAAGAAADKVYLVNVGQVRLERAEGERLWMGNGGEFGFNEYAARVAPGATYTLDHSATAVTPVTAFSVPRRQFIAIAGLSPEDRSRRLRDERRLVLDQVSVLSAYSDDEKLHLLGYMSHYYIPTTHLVTQQGEIADSMWLLLRGGRARVHAVGADDRALPDMGAEGPTYFSEFALRTQAPAPSTLEAEPGSAWLRLHWQDFRAFVKDMGDTSLESRLKLVAPDTPLGATPTEDDFDWLEPGEAVILKARRHWISLVRKLTPAIVFSILCGWMLAGMVLIGWSATWYVIIAGLLGVAALAAWVWGILDYLNDYLVVTNLRIIRQEKVILLREVRQVAPLEHIQNVDVDISFWGKILGFATVTVRTASTFGAISLNRMGRPELVSDSINRLRELRRRHYAASGRKNIFNLLENRFGLTLTLPSRVTPRGGAAAAAGRQSWWQRLRSRFRAKPVEGLQPGERIVWRKHWLILFRNISVLTLVILALLAGSLFIYWTRYAGEWSGIAALIPAVLTVFLLGWVAWLIADWANDIYILERDQVVDIERLPLGLSEKRRTARLNQIVDLSLSMPTVIHHIFNFGNVVLQTAATQGAFTFDSVPDPRGVIEIVRQRIDGIRRFEEESAMRQRAAELPDWFEISDRLQGSPRSRPDQSGPERLP
jgi:CRP-like cAMP-binding protein